MKETLCIILICVITTTNAGAQKSIGYFRLGVTLLTSIEDDNPILFPGITIVPGLRIIQRKNFLVSISTPITLGSIFENDTYLGIDAPAMLDLSFFSATGNNEKAHAGFIVGGGMAYLNIRSLYDDVDGHKFWGYRFHAGLSFGKGDSGDRTLILLSFAKSATRHQGKVIGISVQGIMGNTKNHTVHNSKVLRAIVEL